jgi:hypothetical protein
MGEYTNKILLYKDLWNQTKIILVRWKGNLISTAEIYQLPVNLTCQKYSDLIKKNITNRIIQKKSEEITTSYYRHQ